MSKPEKQSSEAKPITRPFSDLHIHPRAKSRQQRWVAVWLILLGGVLLESCEKIPPSAAPTEAERQVIEQRVQNYYRRAIASGSNIKISVSDYRVAPLGLLSATIDLTNGVQNQKIAIVVSRDGRYLVQGSMTDLTMDPFKATMEKISLKDVSSRGNAQSPVTIVEYSDFQCPFCARAYKTLEDEVLKQFGDKARLVFKNFPLSMHPWAEAAAIAGLCARRQKEEAFWKLYDVYFTSQESLNSENLKAKSLEALKDSGIDTKAFEGCLDNKETSDQLQAEMAEGTSLGIRSTPTFFINGRKLQGALPIEDFKNAIEEAMTPEPPSAS